MFIKNVLDAIDIIGSKRFEYGYIVVDLNDDARFFFHDLARVPGTPMAQDLELFTPRYLVRDQHDGSFSCELIGLTIRKTPVSGKEGSDEVNPDFLDTLRKTTLTYLTKLASNWELCANTADISQFKETDVVTIQNTFQKDMGAGHCILHRIAGEHNLSPHVNIAGTTTGNYIQGPRKYIQQMGEALIDEMCYAHSLRDRACVFVAHNRMSLSPSDEAAVRALPLALQERINSASALALNCAQPRQSLFQ